MKKLSFLNKGWLCLCLVFASFLSSCAAIRTGREDNVYSGLWSLEIGVKDYGDGELLSRLADWGALGLAGTNVRDSGSQVSGMVLLSPSYDRLNAIRIQLQTLGAYRIKLSKVEE